MSAEAGLGVPLYTISIIVGSLVGFGALLTIIWNFSKKITTIELNLAQRKTEYKDDLARLQEQHLKDVKALETEIQRKAIERREDIAKAMIQHKDDIVNISKQLDSQKADIKSLLSKIEVAYTSITTGEKTHAEIKAEMNRLIGFFTDWIQRVEDRIEGLRKEFLNMFTAFHSHDGDNKLE